MLDHSWTAADIPSLQGKTIVVTGANSGLGFYTTLELARKGALVIMACRTAARAETAMQAIKSEFSDARLEFVPLDLASLVSIRSFVDQVQQQTTRLDVLINNAGIMAIPHRLTADGFEMQFGTNHLGHFALTGLLYPLLSQSGLSRVVTVSSLMHRFGKMDFDDLMGARSYDPWRAYSQSKLANLLFAYELQRRLTDRRAGVLSLAAHPGYAATHLQFVGAEMQGSAFQRWMNQIANNLLAQPAAQGALPELYAATVPQLEGGSFIGPDGRGGTRGYPRVVKSSDRSYNESDARRLWTVSEELTGIVF